MIIMGYRPCSIVCRLGYIMSIKFGSIRRLYRPTWPTGGRPVTVGQALRSDENFLLALHTPQSDQPIINYWALLCLDKYTIIIMNIRYTYRLQWRLQDFFSGGQTLYIQLFRGAKKPKISISAVV